MSIIVGFNFNKFLMKNYFYLLFLVFFLSCSVDNNNVQKIRRLEKTNDSLTKIVNDIQNKYVFDSISFREIPSPKNTLKLNSEYKLELLVVGYSSKQNYFIKYDSLAQGKKVNPDTLRQSNGGFKYSINLSEKVNPIWIEMNIDNDYGKSKKGVLYDKIKTKPDGSDNK